MRIVSWNVGGPSYRKLQSRALDHLRDELRPAVALLQEVMLDDLRAHAITDGAMVVAIPSTAGASWGSAVVVRGVPAGPLEIEAFGSYLAAVELELGTTRVAFVSAHVCPDAKQRSYLETLLSTLDAREPRLPLVIAGDFNAARHWDEYYGRNVYGWFFDAMAQRVLRDVHFAQHRKEVPSFWGRRSAEPYQLDHAFVSEELAERVTSCDIIDNAAVRELSDHGPLMLELAGERSTR
jgi:endonuclease/exonuclease/phosphatase family metal-dependent hydrolase